jgi:competence ComEA-like helix-hairpin-helix protein
MKKGEKIFLLTSEQWLGVLILSLLLIGTMVAIKHLHADKEALVLVEDSVKTNFENTLAKQDSIYKANKKNYKHDTIEIRMQMFDPNTVDSIRLLHLGFQPWQAKNMLKYRAKGGKYRNKEDLKKLYGMTDSMYLALEPYINIACDTNKVDSISIDSVRTDSLPKWKSQKKDTILNLRTADTTELKMIRGIGSYRAKMIVRYREQLGGYISVEQLLEAKGMNKVVADSILPHFYIDSVVVRTIPVNKTSIEVLMRHPYLNFDKAKAIYEYRRRHIRIKSAEELKKIKELTPEDIEKIVSYLDFSQ